MHRSQFAVVTGESAKLRVTGKHNTVVGIKVGSRVAGADVVAGAYVVAVHEGAGSHEVEAVVDEDVSGVAVDEAVEVVVSIDAIPTDTPLEDCESALPPSPPLSPIVLSTVMYAMRPTKHST